MMTERVPAQLRAAVAKGAIDPQRNTPIGVRPLQRSDWAIESFTVPGVPPLPSADEVYGRGKQFLVEVDPKAIEGDRYFALSTQWMVSKCNSWVISMRRAYEAEIKASQLKLAPVRCTRLAKGDGSQVFDVVSFAANAGSFTGPGDLESTARRLSPWNVYGPFVRAVEQEAEMASTVAGFVVKQETARRYTYRTTFLHAEFGKKRIYDSYVLMVAGPSVLTVVHAIYPGQVDDNDLWSNLSTVLDALYQEPHR